MPKLEVHSKIIREGRLAFSEGMNASDNPYLSVRSTRKRMKWFSGYYQMRTYERLKHIWERRGIQVHEL